MSGVNQTAFPDRLPSRLGDLSALPLFCSSGSTSSSRRTTASNESQRPTSVERPGAVHPWVSAQLRNNPSSVSPALPGSSSAQVQPSHPFIQDPAMPPNPAPNPLTQLEEARRRLEEEKRRTALQQAKQRWGSGRGLQLCFLHLALIFNDHPSLNKAQVWQTSSV